MDVRPTTGSLIVEYSSSGLTAAATGTLSAPESTGAGMGPTGKLQFSNPSSSSPAWGPATTS